ncbi:MAG: serine O-acetyltransferase [Candidatus Omnitrophica bacterium]|nr:serine O-acetyltransferase [Candidatus Omnitrophota bacterium]
MISFFINLSIILVLWYFLVIIKFSDEIKSAQERDPAAGGSFQIVFLYSGLHAIVFYRIAHMFLRQNIPFLPRFISQMAKFLTGIEIHPGAKIGKGLFIDHGTGVVVGETTIIGRNVTLFQGVTLGGTGKEIGKRHPTLGDNIVVGAGAKILGNIKIGSNSYIGANAVVLKEVPPNTTVVGVPGRVTKQDGKKIDKMMDHIHVLDPVMEQMEELKQRIQELEEKVK